MNKYLRLIQVLHLFILIKQDLEKRIKNCFLIESMGFFILFATFNY